MKALKSIIITVILLLFFNLSAISQDFIVRVNGTRTEAIIVDVDSLIVTYYRVSDPEKTLFKLSRDYIDMLIYEDGKDARWMPADAFDLV